MDMLLGEEDYSDLVTYLTGLFSIKKIPEIQIDRYYIRYSSCFILDGPETDRGKTIRRFPEEDERDRIKFVDFTVKGLNSSVESTVRIGWDSIVIEPDVDEKVARDFVDLLDRSTFRYF